jgi:hypothetical protein
MNARLLAAGVLAAAVFPAAVLADGIGPHSSDYEQHAPSPKPQNDVSIVVDRAKHRANMFVSNFCLGSQSGGPGSQSFPNEASATGIRVRHGRFSFNGKATMFTQNGQKRLPARFAATIKPKKATGTARFPGTSCKTIGFTAKLFRRTK